ncbi:MAG: class I SAM-dependent methyltransferase, partial [Saprospiraceae bacterium]
MLRKIYYRLPPAVRLLARKLVYLPTDLLRSDTIAPPKGLIYTGGGDFIKTGEDWRAFFIEHGKLEKHHNALDIGSGIGRMALPLTSYLTKGTYHGFEAMKVGVDWCKENIEKKHSNFHFKHVPLHNDLYNADGIDAATYEFDYPANHFHLAFAISVFTHMIPEELENYLKETAKVLKPGGRLAATFFILDEESEALMKKPNQSTAASLTGNAFTFDYHYGNYSLMDDKVKSANVAFQREYLMELVAKYGFVLEREIKGSWCGRKKEEEIGYQDVLVL